MKKLFDVPRYSIAEWIPFLRLVSVPFIVGFVLLDWRTFAGMAYLVSFSSDALDGFVARNFGMESDRRGRLDSIADEFLLAAGVLAFYRFETTFFHAHLGLILVILSLYVFQLVFSLIRYGTFSSFHTISARAAAVVQAVFLTSIFFFAPVPWLFYTMIVLSAIELLEENLLIAIFPTWRAHVNGIYWVLRERRKEQKAKTLT
ncbi:MAG: CDP-alcohol phosphatidyltransferase family protein [Tunicatimonas sp.]